MQLCRQSCFAAYISVFLVLSLSSTKISAGDSTVVQSPPTVSILTVVDGDPCTAVGAVAKTVTNSFAACESGAWKSREISNPTYVQAVSPIGSVSGTGVYAACPTNKKVLFSSCLIYGASGTFYHDEQGPAGGIYLGFPLPGDQGAYCLYVSGPSSGGYVVVSGVCGDR